MPLRRGVTALAKLKMLRKKYPCDWPGKRDGTHAPAASAWLVGPREPESSLWVNRSHVVGRLSALWGCMLAVWSLDPSVPSSRHEFNREGMGDADANFPSPARASHSGLMRGHVA